MHAGIAFPVNELCREVINKWLLDSGSAALQLLSHSSSRDPEKGGHLPLLPPPAYATDPPIPGIGGD